MDLDVEALTTAARVLNASIRHQFPATSDIAELHRLLPSETNAMPDEIACILVQKLLKPYKAFTF